MAQSVNDIRKGLTPDQLLAWDESNRNSPDGNNYPGGGPVATMSAAQKDQWGNDVGSDQAGTDAFWDQVTNKKRNDFSDQELAGWGVSRISGDKYRLKNGQEVDTVGDFGGTNSMGQWTISGGKQGENGQGVNWGGGGGGGGQVASNGQAVSPAASNGYGAYSNDIHSAISSLLKRGQSPVTEADMMDQFAPADRQLQRGAQRTREQSAERMAQEGINNGGSGGALDTEVNSINEHLGESEGSLMAKLMGDEMTARRQDVINALQFAQGEDKMALQMELAQIDKELRQQQLGLQSKGLDQSNQQFYDTMGYNMSRDQNNDDSRLLELLLA